MSSDKKPHQSFSNPPQKPKKLHRLEETPVYADELAEIKINSHTTRLTFGVVSPESDNPNTTHNIVNESVTVVLPTANFLTAITQMLIPIVENEQLLEVLNEDYSNLAEYAKTQLQLLKSSKK